QTDLQRDERKILKTQQQQHYNHCKDNIDKQKLVDYGTQANNFKRKACTPKIQNNKTTHFYHD
ncbi:MAG: hypothetical protein LBH62_03985, partial [Nitrososphaerota archaeon]|nr:hypothetical protein [Nitrososphaerota archaeon]